MIGVSRLIRSSHLDRSAEIARERNSKLRILQSFPDHPRLFRPDRIQERVSLALNYPVPILLRLTMAHDVHSHDHSLGPPNPIEFTARVSNKTVSMTNKKEQDEWIGPEIVFKVRFWRLDIDVAPHRRLRSQRHHSKFGGE